MSLSDLSADISLAGRRVPVFGIGYTPTPAETQAEQCTSFKIGFFGLLAIGTILVASGMVRTTL